MKITLEIPNNTVCAFFDFVHGDILGLTMQSHSISGAELRDGAVITIKAEKAEGETK